MNLFTWLVTCVGSVVFIEILASVTSIHIFTSSELDLPCECVLVTLFNGFDCYCWQKIFIQLLCMLLFGLYSFQVELPLT